MCHEMLTQRQHPTYVIAGQMSLVNGNNVGWVLALFDFKEIV